MSLVNKLAPLLLKNISDRHFSTIQYIYKQRRWPDFSKPRTLNEKIQWLKLNYRDPLMVQCVDKLAVRDYVTKRGVADILIPLLDSYADADAIPFARLPSSFALKATHGSGWNIICPDKQKLDTRAARAKLARWLAMNFGDVGRE
jgi:hypothetical protein